MTAHTLRHLARNKALRVLLLLATALSLTASRKTNYGPHDKAAYMNSVIVDFLRPGLVINILSGSVASDGTITVVYTAADPQGLPLDLGGVYTPGPISLRYVAAYIPKTGTQYTAYTT
ncbi:MAG: hypothetical protein KGN84_09935, partial [Acidobacteriota bacterium]|nr:hypothetical protein [Acidobacteriota bacterium]